MPTFKEKVLQCDLSAPIAEWGIVHTAAWHLKQGEITQETLNECDRLIDLQMHEEVALQVAMGKKR